MRAHYLSVLNRAGLAAAVDPAAREAQLKRQSNIAICIWVSFFILGGSLRLFSNLYNIAPVFLSIAVMGDWFSGERETKVIVQKIEVFKSRIDPVEHPRIFERVPDTENIVDFAQIGFHYFVAKQVVFFVLAFYGSTLGVYFGAALVNKYYSEAAEQLFSISKDVTELSFNYLLKGRFNLYFNATVLIGIVLLYAAHIFRFQNAGSSFNLATKFTLFVKGFIFSIFSGLTLAQIFFDNKFKTFLSNNITLSEVHEQCRNYSEEMGRTPPLVNANTGIPAALILGMFWIAASGVEAIFLLKKASASNMHVAHCYLFAALMFLAGGYTEYLSFMVATVLAGFFGAAGKLKRRALNQNLNKILKEAEALARPSQRETAELKETDVVIELPSLEEDEAAPGQRITHNPLRRRG